MNDINFDHIIRAKPTSNPYRTACHMMASRLLWDLNYRSWVSRFRLDRCHNRHSGKKAVILCNGPSLNEVNLESLANVYTFGLNKINLMFNRTSFRPSCVVAVNQLVIEQNVQFFNVTDLPVFLDSSAKGLISMRKNVHFLHSTPTVKFSRNCRTSIWQGATVTFVALQLAFHMGFEQVALVGCDHNFASKGPANATVKSGDIDKSHFDPKYFSGGQHWQLPDLALSEYAYEIARDNFNAFNRRVVNCTIGGKLELFPRSTLDDFLNG